MTREFRMRPAGVLFFLIVGSNLLLTTEICKNILSLLSSLNEESSTLQVLIAVLSFGFLVITSDAIGYVFSLIDVFLWNLCKRRLCEGYSSSYWPGWDELGIDLQAIALELYEVAEEEKSDKTLHQEFVKMWKSLSPDVILNYFWRQAPDTFIGFADRRNNAFYTNGAIRVGIVSALITSVLSIHLFNLGFNCIVHLVLFFGSLFVLCIVHKNAKNAREEELQFIRLWLSSNINSTLKEVLNNMLPDEKVKEIMVSIP